MGFNSNLSRLSMLALEGVTYRDIWQCFFKAVQISALGRD